MNNNTECPVCFDVFPYSQMTRFPCSDAVCEDCSREYFDEKIRNCELDYSCPTCKLPNVVQNTAESRQYIDWLKKWLKRRLSALQFARFEKLLLENSALNSNGIQCPEVNLLSKELEALRWSNDFILFKCRQCKVSAIIEPPASCLHITCRRCSFESCRGCNQPFYRQKCKPNNVVCTYSGLHCHHPRYCAYYMRDFSVAELTGLLQTAGVTVPPPKMTAAFCSSTDAATEKRCQQRVEYAAFECCRYHSQYMLAQLIRQHRVDPLPILSANDCMQELRRMGVALPERGPYDTDPLYKDICATELKKYKLVFD